MARGKRFGEISKTPSGRYRVRYYGPDGKRHTAGKTFDTKGDADTWLTLRRAEIVRDEWAPADSSVTFGAYASQWIADRRLKPRTREHYRNLLAGHLEPFAAVPLRKITPEMVNRWHAKLATGPTMKAHAYSLLRTILNTALAYDLIRANPCRIRGAGNSVRKVKIKPATVAELATITDAMPPEYRLMVLLGAWCSMRYGELAALRRMDVEPDGSLIRIRRAVARVKGEMVEGDPKTEAGRRDIAIPPHIAAQVVEHLAKHTAPGKSGLLFPSRTGGFLPTVTLYKYWYAAREAAGRPDLRFHDLRHTGATLAAQSGATLAELMARLGHTTAGAALRYQHTAGDRDRALAARLSALATGSRGTTSTTP